MINHQDSLFTEYILEQQGLTVVTHPFGFYNYKIVGEECFLGDMFVKAPERRAGNFVRLLRELETTARANLCAVITANIYLVRDPNANRTLRAAIACGFKVKRANNDVLLMVLDLKRES